jgi:sterol desaturase/sphingolipid hydroxylase (fatty acid hydroxylase superfamily)
MLAYTPEYIEARDSWPGIEDGPAKPNRSKRTGIKVFQNTFVERFLARSHWVLPGVWFFPIAAFCIYQGAAVRQLSALSLVGGFLGGLLAWTLLEYTLHRWVFHLSLGTGAFRRNILFMAHGYHHEFPDDPGRLVAPPLMSWPIAAVLAALYLTVLGPFAEVAFAGTLVGYIAYDWVHYYTHHARPTSRLGQYIRRYHILHHHRDHDAKYGISSPLWDVIIGTYGTPVYGREKSSESPST